MIVSRTWRADTRARSNWHLALAFLAAFLAPLAAESSRTPEINAALRQEEKAHSEIMRTMHFLTDVYGPRLTGSPHAKAAAEWVVKTMGGWGFENGHLEPWEFGHPGWENEHVTAHVVSPIKDQLTVEVLAWSPGTKGTVTAPAFQLAPPDRPSPAELTAYFDSVRTEIKGKIVMASRAVAVPPRLEPRPTRIDEARLRSLYDPNRAPSQGRGQGQSQTPLPPMTRAEVNRRIDEFLLLNGAAVRINDAGRELGQIAAFNNPTYDVSKVVPTVVMRNEDYGRLARILADGTAVTLEFNIVNSTYPDGHTSFNAIAELPGTEKKDQVVMLGGHLDSWHSATGATDNAIGCATMMEAMRLLKAIGVKPRRTVRLALWTGEEHGLLGSQAYIRQHFGPFEEPQARLLCAVCILESRHWHGSDSRGQRFRSAGRSRRAAFDARAVCRSRSGGRRREQSPVARRYRQHDVQRRRTPRYQLRSGSDSIRRGHASHKPRHLRTHRGRRCPCIRGRDCRGRVRACDARRPAAAVRQEHDADWVMEVMNGFGLSALDFRPWALGHHIR
jgi:hypothetical protein